MTSQVKRRRVAAAAAEKCREVAPPVADVDGTSGAPVSPRKPLLSSTTVNRLIVRLAFLCGAVLVYMFTRKTEVSLVNVSEVIGKRSQPVDCSSQFSQDVAQYKGCSPNSCGRLISDRVVMETEAEILKAMAIGAFDLTGGATGSASILDLHTGAVSRADKFVNIYRLPDVSHVITFSHLQLYRSVKDRVLQVVADHFGVSAGSLHLTRPTFFSRLTSQPPRTQHDQYWHVHVDKETYPSFHYTGLLYLSSYGTDFTGGRFIFHDHDANRTIEPKSGRVSVFTSGWENRHQVERVSSGVRYALTISFTCDEQQAIADPSLLH